MDYYEIPYNAAIINEILQLCGKHIENPNNLIAADNWFKYYLEHIFKQGDQFAGPSPSVLFNTYLNLWSKTGDKHKIKEIYQLAQMNQVAITGFTRVFIVKKRNQTSVALGSH